jgi:hypothetical protein
MPLSLTRLVSELHRLAVPPESDAELLDRFARQRDEAAFGALVERHGPMVLRLCRRVLGDAHAADDAFQATFLVRPARLARCVIRPRWPAGSMASPSGLLSRHAAPNGVGPRRPVLPKHAIWRPIRSRS